MTLKLILKYLLSAGIITLVSEMVKRSDKLGALLAPTLLGVGPAEGAFDADGVPTEPGIRRKVDHLVTELTQFSRGGS